MDAHPIETPKVYESDSKPKCRRERPNERVKRPNDSIGDGLFQSWYRLISGEWVKTQVWVRIDYLAAGGGGIPQGEDNKVCPLEAVHSLQHNAPGVGRMNNALGRRAAGPQVRFQDRTAMAGMEMRIDSKVTGNASP